jgi:hypothetical protein
MQIWCGCQTSTFELYFYYHGEESLKWVDLCIALLFLLGNDKILLSYFP